MFLNMWTAELRNLAILLLVWFVTCSHCYISSFSFTSNRRNSRVDCYCNLNVATTPSRSQIWPHWQAQSHAVIFSSAARQRNCILVSHDMQINKRLASNRLYSIINGGDQWSVYASLAVVAAAGLKSEKTVVGRSLSGPVTAMLFASILTNVGILPHEGSIFVGQLQQFVVKLATPLLLLGADLREIFRETGILLRAFLLGSVGTLLGSTVAFTLFGRYLDDEGWKIVSALTAKNIGGGLNFMVL